MINAVVEGDLKRVEELLDNGAKVNAVDKYDRTPLHEAAWIGDIDITRLLLERVQT